jgi:hypothetical protein
MALSLRAILLVKVALSMTQGPRIKRSFFPPRVLPPMVMIGRGIAAA